MDAGTHPTSDVIERSLIVCPRNAWLYYTAAQIVLSKLKTNSKDGTGQAIRCLQKCIQSFYDQDSLYLVVADPLFLYR